MLPTFQQRTQVDGSSHKICCCKSELLTTAMLFLAADVFVAAAVAGDAAFVL